MDEPFYTNGTILHNRVVCFVSQNGDAMDREAEEESLPGPRSQIRASTKIAAGYVIS